MRALDLADEGKPAKVADELTRSDDAGGDAGASNGDDPTLGRRAEDALRQELERELRDFISQFDALRERMKPHEPFIQPTINFVGRVRGILDELGAKEKIRAAGKPGAGS